MLLMHQPSRKSVAVSLHKVSPITLYLSKYVLIAATPFHKFQKTKCGVSSGSSSLSSFSSLASWSASSPLRYATLTNRFSHIFFIIIIIIFCYFGPGILLICASCRKRRLSKKKMRSTLSPLPGRTAQFRWHYRHRLCYY